MDLVTAKKRIAYGFAPDHCYPQAIRPDSEQALLILLRQFSYRPVRKVIVECNQPMANHDE